MRYTRTKLAVWGLAALLLAACSSGGGGGGILPVSNSSLSITTTDAAGTQETFTANNSNSVMAAHANTDDGKTIIEICSDVDNDNDCSRLFILTIDGTTAQTYSMASPDSLTQIVYHDDETETGVLSHYLSSDGQIVITEEGSRVKGTFATNLACNSGCSGALAVNGSFDVVLSN